MNTKKSTLLHHHVFPTPRLRVFVAGIFAAAIASGDAFAGTLSFNGGGNATVTPTGVSLTTVVTPFQLSTFSFSGGNAIKLQGEELFTDTEGGGGSIVVSFTGSGTANAGDFASLFYQFTLELIGTGTVTPTVNVNALLLNFFPVNVTEQLPPAGPGITPYGPDTVQSSPAPVGGSATFSADATFVWTGGTAGDTLRITVPSNSIDLGLAPTAVPEPGTAGLLLLAAPLLAWIRRRPGVAPV